MAIDSSLAVSVGIPMFSVIGVLVGVIYTTLRNKILYLEKRDADKEKRLTVLETEKKLELLNLERTLEKLQKEIEQLKKQIHDHIVINDKMLKLIEKLSKNAEV